MIRADIGNLGIPDQCIPSYGPMDWVGAIEELRVKEGQACWSGAVPRAPSPIPVFSMEASDSEGVSARDSSTGRVTPRASESSSYALRKTIQKVCKVCRATQGINWTSYEGGHRCGTCYLRAWHQVYGKRKHGRKRSSFKNSPQT